MFKNGHCESQEGLLQRLELKWQLLKRWESNKKALYREVQGFKKGAYKLL